MHSLTDLRLLVLPSVPASPLPDLLMMTLITDHWMSGERRENGPGLCQWSSAACL